MSTFAQTLDITFSSERLSYRLFNVSDAAELQAMTDNPAVTDVISFLSSPFTLEDAVSFLEDMSSDRDQVYGGWRIADQKLVSLAGAHLNPDNKIEIGYWVGAEFHGMGYGFEAANAMLSKIRTVTPEFEIFAECSPENQASSHLLKKLGFQSTGLDGARAGRKLFNYSRRA